MLNEFRCLIILVTVTIFGYNSSLAYHLSINDTDEGKVIHVYDADFQPITTLLLKSPFTSVLSDSEKLDRLARGAEYVDKFDIIDPGKSEFVNPLDVKDFAEDPALKMITTYGQDRLKEENIKRNLFKVAHEPLYVANDLERRIFIKNSTPTIVETVSNAIKKIGFDFLNRLHI